MKKQLFIAITLSAMLFSSCSSNSNKEAAKPAHHVHDHTPHHGVEATIVAEDSSTGIAELKLHDDKGDLELWLTNHDHAHSPMDLPLNTKITVQFTSLKNKEVVLQVRNKNKNEDEDGQGNIRNGKTNYFIFPGNTKADSSFLVGKDFSSEVIIKFSVNGKKYQTKPFTLVPHVH